MQDEAAQSRALQEVTDLVALINTPGWALLAGEMRKREAEYDAMLHRENVENVARMAAVQASCRSWHEAQTLPEHLLAQRQEILHEDDVVWDAPEGR
ncbi:MAG TPA: hypothetical protein VHV83_12745 [Armatimonadota bacterium]|nr:hypothetical protein [Armatimonadota bacterium]